MSNNMEEINNYKYGIKSTIAQVIIFNLFKSHS